MAETSRRMEGRSTKKAGRNCSETVRVRRRGKSFIKVFIVRNFFSSFTTFFSFFPYFSALYLKACLQINFLALLMKNSLFAGRRLINVLRSGRCVKKNVFYSTLFCHRNQSCSFILSMCVHFSVGKPLIYTANKV